MESILNKIADYLARRDHSVKEIKDKLTEKKIYDLAEINEAIQKAKDLKWFLPENELAEKVAQFLTLRSKSHYYINGYLKEKGLPTIEFSEARELSAINKCLSKKFKNPNNLTYNDKLKAIRLLSSRGFHRETCYKILNQNFDLD